MGKQPAVIIIARHGARLDAADKSWHLTSPTPYDPPLTYGGWTQSRALGLRIASLLHSLEEPLPESQESTPVRNGSTIEGAQSRSHKRKFKVYIHSSPFQRCVQTGIGISSGISQFQGVLNNSQRSDSRPRSASGAARSPRLHAVDTTAAAVVARNNARNSFAAKHFKSTLRVDAYLGEWLSPDYFESITPPPNSIMMVAGAKADLLRRGEEINSYSLSPSLANKGSSGNLWSGTRSTESLPEPNTTSGPLDLKQLSQALPGRDRTSSYNSGRISPFGRPSVHRGISGERSASIGYIPPAPTYAISPVDPIPRGYVAHARDACVDVDYHWDSMREPLVWGDGGEYGEEWSAMHKRFRKGLDHMIDWYNQNGTASAPDEDEAVPEVDEVEEDERDVAVVLVTHGAGCNALIGALTEQPVLIDVGMASMTMAVRKTVKNIPHESPVQIATPESSPELSRGSRRSPSRGAGLSSSYEMKIVASSEHLRPVMTASKTLPESRRRSTLTTDGRDGTCIRRLSTQSIAPQRSGSVSSAASMSGLWTPSTPPDRSRSPGGDGASDDLNSIDNKLGISFALDQPASEGTLLSTIPSRSSDIDPITAISATTTLGSSPGKEASDSVGELPRVSPQVPIAIGRTLSQKGLWGSAPSGFQARDRGPKRRWTLQQE
ncbi:hypothetical protein ANO11243_079560 [Dothideomycetidae sp. 11243]|nr:hypothetical protein ANO11243_079560 [fungal sp. No.11243]